MELRVLLVWVHRMSQRNFGDRVSTGSKLPSMLGGGATGLLVNARRDKNMFQKNFFMKKIWSCDKKLFRVGNSKFINLFVFLSTKTWSLSRKNLSRYERQL